MSQNIYEPNLLYNYSREGKALYSLAKLLRLHFLRHTPVDKIGVSEQLISDAAREVQEIRATLDDSTFQFHQDLNHEVYNGERRRVFINIEGMLYDDIDATKRVQTAEIALPIDLGNNAYTLFKKVKPHNTTTDYSVTIDKALEYLDDNNVLRELFNFFEIRKSRFFYFGENDLKKFFDGREQVAAELMRATAMSKDFFSVGRPPTYEEYMQVAIPHTDYRFKHSVSETAAKKLTNEHLYIERDDYGKIVKENIITDWVGHRVVVRDNEEVSRLENLLIESSKEHRRLGKNGTSEIVSIYQNPFKTESVKGRKFMADVLVNGRSKPTTREIQIMTLDDYFNYEFGTSNHLGYEIQRTKMNHRKRGYFEHFKKILDRVFGSSTIIIDLKKGGVLD